MRRFLFPLLTLLLLAGCAARQSSAQFIGYTSPQTVQATLATNTACTGGAQDFETGITPGFRNLGQTQHYAFISYSSQPLTSSLVIKGVDTSGNTTIISDTVNGQPSPAGNAAVIVGLGYYPNIIVEVKCNATGAPTFTLTYMGASATAFSPLGSTTAARVDKSLFSNVAAGATTNTGLVLSPFGNSSGAIDFKFLGGTGPAGSSILVGCSGSASINNLTFTFNLAQTTADQVFFLPPGPCAFYRVEYDPGGASANTFNLDYWFSPYPGPPIYQYKNITTNTNTQVKTGSGYLHTLVINTVGSAETLTLFDGASCAGTKIGTATLTATDTFFTFDVQFAQGLCVTSAGTTPGDYTVTFQ